MDAGGPDLRSVALPHFLLIELRRVAQEADSDLHACWCDRFQPRATSAWTTSELLVLSRQAEVIALVSGPGLHLGRCRRIRLRFVLPQMSLAPSHPPVYY